MDHLESMRTGLRAALRNQKWFFYGIIQRTLGFLCPRVWVHFYRLCQGAPTTCLTRLECTSIKMMGQTNTGRINKVKDFLVIPLPQAINTQEFKIMEAVIEL